MVQRLETNNHTYNEEIVFTLTPSAFLLLPLFPPERGMSTKRKRSKMVKKNGTKAEKRREGIVDPSNLARWKETLHTKESQKIKPVQQKRKKPRRRKLDSGHFPSFLWLTSSGTECQCLWLKLTDRWRMASWEQRLILVVDQKHS